MKKAGIKSRDVMSVGEMKYGETGTSEENGGREMRKAPEVNEGRKRG